MIPTVIPYRPEHSMIMINRDTGQGDSWESARGKYICGPAWSAAVNNQIIFCAGVGIPWLGMGMAWVNVSKEAERYPVFMTKIVRKVLCGIIWDCRLHRVEAVARLDDPRSCEWLCSLGFVEEGGVAHKFTSDKHHMVRFELVL